MPQPPRVQLFITCIVDSLFPQVGEAVIDVLKRLGVDVEFPEAQTCCGQPAYNAGFRDEAREAALHFMNVFSSPPSVPPLLTASFDFAQDARSGEGGWGGEAVPYILTPSGSCAAMIVHGYGDLFADDPANLARAPGVSPPPPPAARRDSSSRPRAFFWGPPPPPPPRPGRGPPPFRVFRGGGGQQPW